MEKCQLVRVLCYSASRNVNRVVRVQSELFALSSHLTSAAAAVDK